MEKEIAFCMKYGRLEDVSSPKAYSETTIMKVNLELLTLNSPLYSAAIYPQHGRVEGRTFIFTGELQNYNLLLKNTCQENVGSHQKNKKDTPHSKGKEKPQQDAGRSEIAF